MLRFHLSFPDHMHRFDARQDDAGITKILEDHRNIKSQTKVMLGFMLFRGAAHMISGIELMHRTRKGRFNLATLNIKDAATPTVWNAVLSD